jgi:NAD(P)-dependent dehydrogenase (short-subunit alcohol dehydrogenase family)
VGSISDNRLGGWYSYRASKAALNQLTRTLALELERKKLPVAAVLLHPGTCDTGLSEPFQKVGRSGWLAVLCVLCSLVGRTAASCIAGFALHVDIAVCCHRLHAVQQAP